MSKFTVIVFSILFLGLSSLIAPEGKGEIIYWTADAQLVWDDFQAEEDTRSPYEALSHCGLEMDMKQVNATELEFTVRATFETDKSWVSGEESTDYLLTHEQLHFDIYERYARELRKRLSEFAYDDKETISEDLGAIYKEVNQLINDAQSAYDSETDHSRVVDAQYEWAEKIETELNELVLYDNPSFTVQIAW